MFEKKILPWFIVKALIERILELLLKPWSIIVL